MFLGPQNKETGRVYVYLVGQVRLAGVPLCAGAQGERKGRTYSGGPAERLGLSE